MLFDHFDPLALFGESSGWPDCMDQKRVTRQKRTGCRHDKLFSSLFRSVAGIFCHGAVNRRRKTGELNFIRKTENQSCRINGKSLKGPTHVKGTNRIAVLKHPLPVDDTSEGIFMNSRIEADGFFPAVYLMRPLPDHFFEGFWLPVSEKFDLIDSLFQNEASRAVEYSEEIQDRTALNEVSFREDGEIALNGNPAVAPHFLNGFERENAFTIRFLAESIREKEGKSRREKKEKAFQDAESYA
jgi:hypothetical protein